MDTSDINKGRMLGRGRTAEIFEWEKERVLKLYYPDVHAEDIEYEARATEYAYNAGLPVPTVHGVTELDGRKGIIFERIDGPLLDTEVGKPWKFSRLANAMADLHAMLHACEVMEGNSLHESLSRTIGNLDILPGNIKSSLLDRLRHLPDGNMICHGDFHPQNIILSTKGPVIIDWSDAKRGNPFADVARTSLLLRVGTPPGVSAVGRRLHMIGGSLLNRAYLKRYLQVRKCSYRDIDNWMPVIAAARLAEKIPGEEKILLAIVRRGLESRE